MSAARAASGISQSDRRRVSAAVTSRVARLADAAVLDAMSETPAVTPDQPSSEAIPLGRRPVRELRWSVRRLVTADIPPPAAARCLPRTCMMIGATSAISEDADSARMPENRAMRSVTPPRLLPNSDSSKPLPCSDGILRGDAAAEQIPEVRQHAAVVLPGIQHLRDLLSPGLRRGHVAERGDRGGNEPGEGLVRVLAGLSNVRGRLGHDFRCEIALDLVDQVGCHWTVLLLVRRGDASFLTLSELRNRWIRLDRASRFPRRDDTKERGGGRALLLKLDRRRPLRTATTPSTGKTQCTTITHVDPTASVNLKRDEEITIHGSQEGC